MKHTTIKREPRVTPRKATKVFESDPVETAEPRARRAGLMKQIRHLEWTFDREATVEKAARLRGLRQELNDLEQGIAEVTQDANLKREVVRSYLNLTKLGQVGEEKGDE